MYVSEIYKGIQGEGPYVGYPCLFIRLHGCNLCCGFCDKKYSFEGQIPTYYRNEKIVEEIKKAGMKRIVFTGGEPCLQMDDIIEIIEAVWQTKGNELFHLETNGTIDIDGPFYFESIIVSPKDGTNIVVPRDPDTTLYKVVTDLKTVGNEINNADYLMPLSTGNRADDLEIKQKVWEYCIEHGLRYSPRLQVDTWGLKATGR